MKVLYEYLKEALSLKDEIKRISMNQTTYDEMMNYCNSLQCTNVLHGNNIFIDNGLKDGILEVV